MLKKLNKDDSLYDSSGAKRKRVINKIAEFIKTIPNFIILFGIVWLVALMCLPGLKMERSII